MYSDDRLRTKLVGVEQALADAGLFADSPENRPKIAPRDDIRDLGTSEVHDWSIESAFFHRDHRDLPLGRAAFGH